MEKQSATALIADDCEGQRRMLATVVNALGVGVDFAKDGKEAVAAFRKTAFDIIFMDVSMPVMNGLEATAMIRAEEKVSQSPRTPIYIVTSHDEDAYRQAAIEAGADGHIGKPTSPSRLIEALCLSGALAAMDTRRPRATASPPAAVPLAHA
jgi:CheY-like chemotaxis protein